MIQPCQRNMHRHVHMTPDGGQTQERNKSDAKNSVEQIEIGRRSKGYINPMEPRGRKLRGKNHIGVINMPNSRLQLWHLPLNWQNGFFMPRSRVVYFGFRVTTTLSFFYFLATPWLRQHLHPAQTRRCCCKQRDGHNDDF